MSVASALDRVTARGSFRVTAAVAFVTAAAAVAFVLRTVPATVVSAWAEWVPTGGGWNWSVPASNEEVGFAGVECAGGDVGDGHDASAATVTTPPMTAMRPPAGGGCR